MTFIVRISHHKWSDTVSPEMHAIRCIAIFNKDNKVSCRLSHKLHHHLWREIHRIKVIKCPPNYIPWRDINSNFNPNLEITWIQKLSLKVTNRWFTHRPFKQDTSWHLSKLSLMCLSGHKRFSLESSLYFFFCSWWNYLCHLAKQKSRKRNNRLKFHLVCSKLLGNLNNRKRGLCVTYRE